MHVLTIQKPVLFSSHVYKPIIGFHPFNTRNLNTAPLTGSCLSNEPIRLNRKVRLISISNNYQDTHRYKINKNHHNAFKNIALFDHIYNVCPVKYTSVILV